MAYQITCLSDYISTPYISTPFSRVSEAGTVCDIFVYRYVIYLCTGMCTVCGCSAVCAQCVVVIPHVHCVWWRFSCTVWGGTWSEWYRVAKTHSMPYLYMYLSCYEMYLSCYGMYNKYIPRRIACLIFTAPFPQKRPTISSPFSEKDL